MKRVLVILAAVILAQTAFGQDTGPPSAADEGVDFPYGLILAEQARASFTLQGAGARAVAMGGAFTAVADDASAASFNPAGLAQLLEPEASIVMSGTEVTDSYEDFVSVGEDSPRLFFTDAEVKFDKTNLNFLSLTYPFRMADKRWAVQFSRHIRVDFEYEGAVNFIASDPQGRLKQRVYQDSRQVGDIDTVTASLAVELTPRTLVGLSVNRWDGDWGLASTNQRSLPTNLDLREGFTYFQESRLRGYNVDLGLLLRYPKFNFGVRYSTGFDADFALRTATVPTAEGAVTLLDTTINWPAMVNAGLAFRPTENWTIALDWGRVDWSELTFDVPVSGFPADVEINFFDLQALRDTHTGDTEDWRLGTEVLLYSGRTVIPLRFGVFREPQPSRDIYTNKQIVVEGVSAGFGFKRGSFAFDLAARYSESDTFVSRFFLAEDLATSDLSPNSVGNLKRDELSIYASLIIQFPRGSKTSNLLHRIFVGPVEKDGANAGNSD